MAHKTKVNGTAYDIVGGLTKVNGTDYNIIKGKTKVGGTNYDIQFEEEWEWPGWANATWYDLNRVCVEIQNGNLSNFPSDINTNINRTKTVSLYIPSSNTYGLPSGYQDFTAHLVRVDTTNKQLAFLVPFNITLPYASSTTYTQKYSTSKLKSFCNYITSYCSSQNLSRSYMVPQTRYAVYYKNSNSLTLETMTNCYWFVPNNRELASHQSSVYNFNLDSGDSTYNNYIKDNIFLVSRIPNQGFWTASQAPYSSDTSKVSAIYVKRTDASTLSNAVGRHLLTDPFSKVAVMCIIGNPNGV